MASPNQSPDSLKQLAKFYRRNGVQFVVASNIPPPTNFLFSQRFTATDTYQVTPGRTLYMTDLYIANAATGTQWDVEIPSGKIAYTLMSPASRSLLTPLTARGAITVKFTLTGASGPLNVQGYEA
jgi:hypothetical protein